MALEHKYRQLLELKNNRNPSNNSLYKTGFLLFCGAFVMGCIWMVYSLGVSKGKTKNNERCKCY